MKEINQEDLDKINKIISNLEKHQSLLRKNVVHPLRGTAIHKISENIFNQAVSSAKRVLDNNEKQIKHLKKLLK